MNLKNAAIFLFAAAIVNLLSLCIRYGSYLADFGVSFFTVTRSLRLVAAFAESVIFLVLAWSYISLHYNLLTRKTMAVLLSVVSGIWIVVYLVDFAKRVDLMRETPVDYLIWVGLIVLMSTSQLLLGITVALGKTAGIRKAALPVAIVAAAWTLFLVYHVGMRHYHFGWTSSYRLRLVGETMNSLLPAAIFFWALALFRSRENELKGNTSVIDQL